MTNATNEHWAAIDRIIQRSWPRFTNDGISFSGPSAIPIEERVRANAVLEYWVQQYVFSHPEQLGLKELEGPFETGPDFKAKIRGFRTKVDIEVEVRCENYVKHGHPENPKWKNVKLLIVLEEAEPNQELKAKLPKRIVHINKEHFTPWYKDAARAYAVQKEADDDLNRNLARIRMIAWRIHHNWLEVCPHRGRDMATCPNCELCPYFGQGTGEANEVFDELALQFLQERQTPAQLFLGDVATVEIDSFCDRVFRGGQ